MTYSPLLDNLTPLDPPLHKIFYFSIFYTYGKGKRKVHLNFCQHLFLKFSEVTFISNQEISINQFLSLVEVNQANINLAILFSCFIVL